jgi:hypothetical protein
METEAIKKSVNNINLYLDIDGVILGRKPGGEVALIPDIEEFLIYTRDNFNCFWLTAHGRYAVDDVYAYLKPYFQDLEMSLLKHIQALQWNTLKTDAIDFDLPFIWIDDAPLEYELQILEKKGCLKNWLHVDTTRDYFDLTIEKVESKRLDVLRE